MTTEQKLVNFVTKLLSISAFALYLFAVIQIGQISLAHPNFIAAKNSRGQVIMEDGQPKMIPSPQPTIPDTVAIINTSIGAALALNFGAVIGISVSRASAQQVPGVPKNPGNPGDPGSIFPQTQFNADISGNFNGQPGTNPSQILIWLKNVTEGLIVTVLSVGNGLISLHVRYWAVIIYLISLAIGIVFFYKDGGFNADPGTIAVDLKNTFLTAVGIAGGIMSSLQKPNS